MARLQMETTLAVLGDDRRYPTELMDKLTFISSIVASVAWPTCVIVVALLFKEQLTDLLARMV